MKFGLQRLFSGDEIEKLIDQIDGFVNSAAQIFVTSNLFVTILLAISFKSFWYMLHVMQVLAFLRFFAPWPATIDKTLAQIYSGITLQPLTEPIFEYGKSKF